MRVGSGLRDPRERQEGRGRKGGRWGFPRSGSGPSLQGEVRVGRVGGVMMLKSRGDERRRGEVECVCVFSFGLICQPEERARLQLGRRETPHEGGLSSLRPGQEVAKLTLGTGQGRRKRGGDEVRFAPLPPPRIVLPGLRSDSVTNE